MKNGLEIDSQNRGQPASIKQKGISWPTYCNLYNNSEKGSKYITFNQASSFLRYFFIIQKLPAISLSFVTIALGMAGVPEKKVRKYD